MFFWFPHKPKSNPDFDPHSKTNLGAIFLGTQLSKFQIRSDRTHPVNTSNSSFKNHIIHILIERVWFQNSHVQISRIIQILSHKLFCKDHYDILIAWVSCRKKHNSYRLIHVLVLLDVKTSQIVVIMISLSVFNFHHKNILCLKFLNLLLLKQRKFYNFWNYFAIGEITAVNNKQKALRI